MKNKSKKIIASLALMIFTLSAILNTFAACSLTASAKGPDKEEEESLSPYFIIQSENSSVESFPLKSTDVHSTINGVIAEIYVTQTYVNEGTTPISGTYVFPISTSATVHGMTMQVGNQRVTAKIKEKEEAKKEYETAKKEGKSASLLEQKRSNVFTMNVANIMPGETALIELHYTELITPTEGIYEFSFPTVVGPRYSPANDNNTVDTENTDNANAERANAKMNKADSVSDNDAESETKDSLENNNDVSNGDVNDDDNWTVTPYLPAGVTPPGKYNITVDLSTGVPLSEVTCKSHEIQVTQDDPSKAHITLSNPEDYAGNRDFILKYKLTGEEIQSGLVCTEGDDENFFMLTVQPPEHYTLEDIPPREYIFVLDVSGSMSGYPLDTAKKLIGNLVGDLRETDTFNLLLFSGDSAQMSPTSVPATSKNIWKALALINQEQGYGGTELAPALKNAIDIPKEDDTARSIIVITDGYISNEMDIFDLIHENMDTTSFFSFGIGTSVNDYLINGIAKAGSGESFIVTDSEDAKEYADNFRTYIESPLLTDISISYDGFDVYDVEPAVPSTLFAQKPIVLFGKWKGDPKGTIHITGKSGSEEYTQDIPVSDLTVEQDSEAIRYLWARSRLDRITGYGTIRNDSTVKDEITKLGLDYSMATQYTSFVCVIDVVKNPEGRSDNYNQASPLPLKVSNLAIGYTSLPEPGWILLPAVLAIILLPNIIRNSKSRTGIRR